MSESLLCWTQAIAAIRLRKVISGDVIPRENEPMDLVLMAAMGRVQGERNGQRRTHNGMDRADAGLSGSTV